MDPAMQFDGMFFLQCCPLDCLVFMSTDHFATCEVVVLAGSINL